MSTRKDWNRLASFIGKPGYEILCAHHLDMAGEGIWDPDIAPGDLVHVVNLYDSFRGKDFYRTGVLVKWGNHNGLDRIGAQVLNNAGELEWWDHYWRLEKD